MELEQFKKYLENTSRAEAWERRRSMYAPLTGHTCMSINALVAAVDGNSRDKAWASQAMKDGIIQRDERGFLRLGDADVLQGETFESEDEELKERAQRLLMQIANAELSDALVQAVEATYNRVTERQAQEDSDQ